MSGVTTTGFPNPLGWLLGQAGGLVGGVAAGGFNLVIGGLTTWVLGAVEWVVGAVFNFFLSATDPNVSATWFVGGHGPYATTLGIAAALLVGFVLAGITQGALAGDAAGMLRRVSLELPLAVIGMVGLVSVTEILIRLTDALSRGLLDDFATDVHRFTATVGAISSLGGGVAGGFAVFLLALVSVLAGIVLLAELVVRSALIYIVVALAPLVFAAGLWPVLRGMGRKTLELLVALVVSKLVVAVALVVAAAAAADTAIGGVSGGVSSPAVATQGGGGSITQAIGVLLAATAAFGVAAFSPLLVARLLPITEAAAVASGIRGAPVRAGQQALSASYYTHATGRSRTAALASGPPPGAIGAGAGGPGAGGGAGGAAAGAAIAAKATAGAAGAGVRAASAPVPGPSGSPPSGRPGSTPPRQPPRPKEDR